MRMRARVSLAVVVVAAFLSGVLFTTVGANVLQLEDLAGTPSHAGTTEVSPGPAAVQLQEAFTAVARSVNPTVVQIRSQRVMNRPETQNPFEGTPFEDFFGGPFGGNGQPEEYRSGGLGSGVIIRSDGYIITNNHVIAGADELTVSLFDGTEYEAEVVGADAPSDLAVIKVEVDDLPAISFGTVNDLQVGQWVLAFGSPLSEDLGNTVTAGIVSALGRVSSQLTELNAYADFIQTDAAINPGNSGGPLVDLNGRLIGINSAIVSRTGGYQGIGFAIPINVVQNVTTQLIEDGSVTRGFLGVFFDRVPESLAEAMNVPLGSAQVTQVTPGTPAERANLNAGDIIVSVDGQDLRNFNQLRTIIGNKAPGDEIDMIVVEPSGDRREITVTLGERPDDAVAQGGGEDSDAGGDDAEDIETLGLSVRDLSPAIRQQLGIDSGLEGVFVADVERGSDAFREAELRPNDIIVEVNREPVSSVEEFTAVYRRVDSGESFIVRVERVVQRGETRSFFTALTKP